MTETNAAAKSLADYSQMRMKQALVIIREQMDVTNDEFFLAKLTLLHSSLSLFAMLSKSGNGIPSLRGLGFEPALRLSETIVEDEYVSVGTLQFQFAHFFSEIQLVRG